MAENNQENQNVVEDEVEETALESLKNIIEEMRNANFVTKCFLVDQ